MTFEVVVGKTRSNGYHRPIKRVYTRSQAVRIVKRARRMGFPAHYFKA